VVPNLYKILPPAKYTKDKQESFEKSLESWRVGKRF
jgi:hypothetical protein